MAHQRPDVTGVPGWTQQGVASGGCGGGGWGYGGCGGCGGCGAAAPAMGHGCYGSGGWASCGGASYSTTVPMQVSYGVVPAPGGMAMAHGPHQYPDRLAIHVGFGAPGSAQACGFVPQGAPPAGSPRQPHNLPPPQAGPAVGAKHGVRQEVSAVPQEAGRTVQSGSAKYSQRPGGHQGHAASPRPAASSWGQPFTTPAGGHGEAHPAAPSAQPTASPRWRAFGKAPPAMPSAASPSYPSKPPKQDPSAAPALSPRPAFGQIPAHLSRGGTQRPQPQDPDDPGVDEEAERQKQLSKLGRAALLAELKRLQDLIRRERETQQEVRNQLTSLEERRLATPEAAAAALRDQEARLRAQVEAVHANKQRLGAEIEASQAKLQRVVEESDVAAKLTAQVPKLTNELANANDSLRYHRGHLEKAQHAAAAWEKAAQSGAGHERLRLAKLQTKDEELKLADALAAQSELESSKRNVDGRHGMATEILADLRTKAALAQAVADREQAKADKEQKQVYEARRRLSTLTMGRMELLQQMEDAGLRQSLEAAAGGADRKSAADDLKVQALQARAAALEAELQARTRAVEVANLEGEEYQRAAAAAVALLHERQPRADAIIPATTFVA